MSAFDIFQNKKGIHVKLDKEVHAALRAKLFKYNLSMQEVFDDYARLIAEDNRRAQTLLDSLVQKKLKAAIEGTSMRVKDEQFNELDAESLYNLINGIPKNDSDDQSHEDPK